MLCNQGLNALQTIVGLGRIDAGDVTAILAARDRWLSLMHDAMVEQDLTDDQESQLWMYLIQAAFAMQNVEDDPFSPPLPTEKA